jgi:hypothetical protein
MEGVPNTLRIDPTTGLPAPGAAIRAFLGPIHGMAANFLTTGQELSMPVGEGGGLPAQIAQQGFRIDPGTVNPYGTTYRNAFKPIFDGTFIADGSLSGWFAAGSGTYESFIMRLRSSPTPLGAVIFPTIEASWSFSQLANVAQHMDMSGPFDGSPLVRLSTSKWYEITVSPVTTQARFGATDSCQLNLSEVFV